MVVHNGLFEIIKTITKDNTFFAQQQIKDYWQVAIPEAVTQTQSGDYHEQVSPTNEHRNHLQLLMFQC